MTTSAPESRRRGLSEAKVGFGYPKSTLPEQWGASRFVEHEGSVRLQQMRCVLLPPPCSIWALDSQDIDRNFRIDKIAPHRLRATLEQSPDLAKQGLWAGQHPEGVEGYRMGGANQRKFQSNPSIADPLGGLTFRCLNNANFRSLPTLHRPMSVYLEMS